MENECLERSQEVRTKGKSNVLERLWLKCK